MVGQLIGKLSIDSMGLGPLEGRVMDVIWERGESTVRDVVQNIGPLAYTIVMTTMGRLHGKGFLDRRLNNRVSSAIHQSDVATKIDGGFSFVLFAIARR